MRTMMVAMAALALAGCGSRERTGDHSSAEANAPAAAAPAAGPADPASAEKPIAKAVAGGDLQWGACPPGMPEGCQIALLHGDPAEPNADIFLRVPGGSAIPPHWHSSAERMMLAAGRLEVQYQGAPSATLEPGTYAYGPARLPHRADCRSSEPCILFIAFEGPVDRHDFAGQL